MTSVSECSTVRRQRIMRVLIPVALVGGQTLRVSAAPALQLLDVNLGNKIGLRSFALDNTGDTLAVRLMLRCGNPTRYRTAAVSPCIRGVDRNRDQPKAD
jgi:hypothetical protein